MADGEYWTNYAFHTFYQLLTQVDGVQVAQDVDAEALKSHVTCSKALLDQIQLEVCTNHQSTQ
jgi:hypothetical protein